MTVLYLSKNFTLEELCVTNTWIPNFPNSDELEKLKLLAQTILQPIRDKFGPVTVSSGYRCESVNTAVGGKPTSQHRLGEAADITLETALDVVFRWCIGALKFGQIILEEDDGKHWIHISLTREGAPNQQALIYLNGIYLPYKKGE